jgi:hypothetical protein
MQQVQSVECSNVSLVLTIATQPDQGQNLVTPGPFFLTQKCHFVVRHASIYSSEFQ